MAKKSQPATLTKDNIRGMVARNLRQARVTYDPNMTQLHVAKVFDPPVSRAAVGQWEVGETLPDLDRVAVLSKLYGVTIDSLVFGDDVVKGDLTPEGRTAGRVWQQLTDKHRALMLEMMRSLIFEYSHPSTRR